MSEQQPPQGDPQQQPPQQPPQQPGQPPYGTPPPGYYQAPPGYYQPAPPTPSSATTALIIGIVSLVMCQPAGIAAWIIGRNAMREIDASQGRLGGRGTAQAGYILGIISTVLTVLAVVLVIAIFAIGGLVASQFDNCSFTDGTSTTELHCD
ncbi:MAG: DUF4190 domain-containing protein [Nocardioidaceae bacterium]|nr:DUF4190 domain-containing protein [Nocardioidaceae bacterium]